MKPTKKQKEFAKKCADISCEILLLNSYGRMWHWLEQDISSEQDNCLASINTNLKYKELTIEIYPAFWKTPESAQFDTIFHEFCHVHTEHQYMIGVNLLEGKLVTNRELHNVREHETALFEKAFIWLLHDPKRYNEHRKFLSKLSSTTK